MARRVWSFRPSGLSFGGESVLVNGAVFKTVSETVRAGSGRFDSYTPPPGSEGGKLFFYKEFLT